MAPFLRLGGIALLSVVFIALLAFSGYAVHKATSLNIPIATVTETLAVILPTLNLILLGIVTFSAKLDNRFKLAIGWVVSLLESALIALAASQAPEANLACSLEQTWKDWYSSKAEGEIRAIQDRLQCCGFNSPRDRAWPFPDRTNNATACEVLYRRSTPCFQGWRDEAVKDLKIFMLVGVLALLAKVLTLLVVSWTANPRSAGASGDERRYLSFRQDSRRIASDEEYHDNVDDGGDRNLPQRGVQI